MLQVKRRVKALQTSKEHMPDWNGHVWQGNERIMADSRHRLQDLRIAKDADGAPGVLPSAYGQGISRQPIDALLHMLQ